jgi:hypothetical protein
VLPVTARGARSRLPHDRGEQLDRFEQGVVAGPEAAARNERLDEVEGHLHPRHLVDLRVLQLAPTEPRYRLRVGDAGQAEGPACRTGQQVVEVPPAHQEQRQHAGGAQSQRDTIIEPPVRQGDDRHPARGRS